MENVVEKWRVKSERFLSLFKCIAKVAVYIKNKGGNPTLTDSLKFDLTNFLALWSEKTCKKI